MRKLFFSIFAAIIMFFLGSFMAFGASLSEDLGSPDHTIASIILNGIVLISLIYLPIITIVLFFDGKRLAWHSRKWNSTDEFLIVQQRWDLAGKTVIVIILVSTFLNVAYR